MRKRLKEANHLKCSLSEEPKPPKDGRAIDKTPVGRDQIVPVRSNTRETKSVRSDDDDGETKGGKIDGNQSNSSNCGGKTKFVDEERNNDSDSVGSSLVLSPHNSDDDADLGTSALRLSPRVLHKADRGNAAQILKVEGSRAATAAHKALQVDNLEPAHSTHHKLSIGTTLLLIGACRRFRERQRRARMRSWTLSIVLYLHIQLTMLFCVFYTHMFQKWGTEANSPLMKFLVTASFNMIILVFDLSADVLSETLDLARGGLHMRKRQEPSRKHYPLNNRILFLYYLYRYVFLYSLFKDISSFADWLALEVCGNASGVILFFRPCLTAYFTAFLFYFVLVFRGTKIMVVFPTGR